MQGHRFFCAGQGRLPLDRKAPQEENLPRRAVSDRYAVASQPMEQTHTHNHDHPKDGHDHSHSGHDHSHDRHHGFGHHHHPVFLKEVSRAFMIGIVLNFVFVVIEVITGLYIHSLSLLSDAGHNLADVASLAMALMAIRLLKVKPTDKYTYGYK